MFIFRSKKIADYARWKISDKYFSWFFKQSVGQIEKKYWMKMVGGNWNVYSIGFSGNWDPFYLFLWT